MPVKCLVYVIHSHIQRMGRQRLGEVPCLGSPARVAELGQTMVVWVLRSAPSPHCLVGSANQSMMKSGPDRDPVLRGLRSPLFLPLAALPYSVLPEPTVPPSSEAVCAEDHQPPLPSPPSSFIPGALAAASWPSSVLCCSIKSLPENRAPSLLYQASDPSGKQGRQPLISCLGLFLSTLLSSPGLHPIQNVAGNQKSPKSCPNSNPPNSCKVYAHKPQGNIHLPMWSDLTCLEQSPPTVGGGGGLSEGGQNPGQQDSGCRKWQLIIPPEQRRKKKNQTQVFN